MHLNLEVPSGITPFPWVALILPHKLVLPDLQNLHSLHSGVLEDVSVKSHFGHKVIILESYDMISWLNRSNTLTNGLDNTSSLVSKDNWESTLGVFSGQSVCIYGLSDLYLLNCETGSGAIPVWQTPV